SEEHTSELQSHLNLVSVFCLRSEEHTSELQSHLNLVCVFCLRSEEHTSELQSHLNLVCVFFLRSEEHTSELQSHLNLVCRLLLEKNKYMTTSGHEGRELSFAAHRSSLLRRQSALSAQETVHSCTLIQKPVKQPAFPFFLKDPAPPEPSPLPHHAALPF